MSACGCARIRPVLHVCAGETKCVANCMAKARGFWNDRPLIKSINQRWSELLYVIT